MRTQIGQWFGAGLLFATVLCAGTQPKAEATTLYLGLRIGNTINGVNYDVNDILKYDTVANTASVFFDGDTVFNPQVNKVEIDAFDILSNGDFLISTDRNASIGSLSFTDDDLVRINHTTHAASLFFDGSAVFNKQSGDLEAIDVLPNGHLVFAAGQGEIKKNGLAFTSRDLIEYNPVTGDASIFFKGADNFTGRKGTITGVDVLDDGRLVLIVGDAGRKAHIGGLDVGRRDIFIYDPVKKTAVELLNGDDIFQRTSHQHDQGFGLVDVEQPSPPPPPPAVPEPLSSTLFGLGLGVVGLRGARRRQIKSNA